MSITINGKQYYPKKFEQKESIFTLLLEVDLKGFQHFRTILRNSFPVIYNGEKISAKTAHFFWCQNKEFFTVYLTIGQYKKQEGSFARLFEVSLIARDLALENNIVIGNFLDLFESKGFISKKEKEALFANNKEALLDSHIEQCRYDNPEQIEGLWK